MTRARKSSAHMPTSLGVICDHRWVARETGNGNDGFVCTYCGNTLMATQREDSTELLPCPFCNRDPEQMMRNTGDAVSHESYLAARCREHTDWMTVEQWNRRPRQTKSTEQVLDATTADSVASGEDDGYRPSATTLDPKEPQAGTLGQPATVETVVPLEPTEEMIVAGNDAISSPYPNKRTVRAIYKAMIAAA